MYAIRSYYVQDRVDARQQRIALYEERFRLGLVVAPFKQACPDGDQCCNGGNERERHQQRYP